MLDLIESILPGVPIKLGDLTCIVRGIEFERKKDDIGHTWFEFRVKASPLISEMGVDARAQPECVP